VNNPFLDKVSLERRVLTLLNSKHPARMKLAGLTRAAINEWVSSNGRTISEHVISQVINLSTITNSLADLSGNVDCDAERSSPAAFAAALDELESRIGTEIP